MTDEQQFDLELEDAAAEPEDSLKRSGTASPVSSPSLASTGHQKGHFRSRSISHDGSGFIRPSSPPFASSPGAAHAGLLDYKHQRHGSASAGATSAMATPASPRPFVTLPPPPSAQLVEVDAHAPWVQQSRSVSPPLFPFSMPPLSPTVKAMNPLEEGAASPAARKALDLPDAIMLPSPMSTSPTHSRKRSIGTSTQSGPVSQAASPSPPRINGFHPGASPSAAAPSGSPSQTSLVGATGQGVIALRRRASIDSNAQPPRARQRTASPTRPRSVSPKRSNSQGSSSSQNSDPDSPGTTFRPSKSPRLSPSSGLKHSFSDEALSHTPLGPAAAKRSPSYDDVMSGQNDSPPSPMALLPLRSRSSHLAMPPPSGWELSDDVDESGSDDASGSAGGSDRDDMEEDTESAEAEEDWVSQKRFRTRSGELTVRRHHRRTSSGGSSDEDATGELSPANGQDDDDEDHEQPWGPLVEGVGNRIAAPWNIQGRADGSEIGVQDGHNEQLTMLEHIFVFSKSEWREHRVIVSRSLADWMEDIDICETLEFVYPLLTSLASDDDEVKIGLASNLDRIMWHFYLRCPLVELSPESDAPIMDVDPEDGQAGTSKRPRLSSTAFVPLLGLLLMEPHGDVTAATRLAVVRFLCRLNDQPVPADTRDVETEETTDLNTAVNMLKSPVHEHEGYIFDKGARLFLEAQLLSDVVLGLAHLDPEGDDDNNDDDDSRSQQTTTTPIGMSTPMEGVHINGISRSPEKEQISPVQADDWSEDDAFEPSQRKALLKNSQSSSPAWGAPQGASPAWGEPLCRVSGSTLLERDDGNTSRDSDEIIAGKIAALELSSAIAAHPLCLSGNNLESQVLSETVRLTSDPHVGVRSASAAALGHLAGALSEQVVISQVIPPFEALAADEDVLVRRATCFALSSFVQTLTPDVRRARILWAVKRFANDSQRAVRLALAQLSGELFYALHLARSTIPNELVDFFLGRPLEPTTSPLPPTPADEKAFAPLATTLTTPDDLSLPEARAESKSYFAGSSPEDVEWNAVVAFNLPAAVLALGPQRWRDLRPLHNRLARDHDVDIRRSIAASLHEIAKVIGPNLAAQDLVPLFDAFVVDSNLQVKEAAVAYATELVRALPVDAGRYLLGRYILAMFPPGNDSDFDQSEAKAAAAAKWREREQAAQALHLLAPQYSHDEPSESPFYDVLSRLVRDPAASVRLAAIDAVPDIYLSLKDNLDARRGLVGWLISSLARDTPCRSRCTFVSIVRAIAARTEASSQLVLADLLPTLAHLAQDAVIDVRIAVAREASVLRRAMFKEDPPSLLTEAITNLAKDSSPTVRSYVFSLVAAPLLSESAPPAPSSPPSRVSQGGRSPSAELDAEMLDALDDDTLSASAIRDLDDGLMAMGSSPPPSFRPPLPGAAISAASSSEEDFVRL